MAQRLDKIKADLEVAKEKRAWWDNRIRYLEKKLADEEKTIVHDIVKAADLTPEELAQVMLFFDEAITRWGKWLMRRLYMAWKQ